MKTCRPCSVQAICSASVVSLERAYGSAKVTTCDGLQGIAAALVEAGAAHARGAGVRQLYVHVIAANTAGVGLYVQRGFAREQAEGEAAARALGRPARLLLRRGLGAGEP